MNYVFIYLTPCYNLINRDGSNSVHDLLNSSAIVKIIKILKGGILVEISNSHIGDIRDKLQDMKIRKIIKDYHEINYTTLPAFIH